MTWLLSCTSFSNIPGLPQTAWIHVSYAGWRGSIEKTVGGYEFGGIKRQYGFSMAGAGDDLVWPGVHFQSPPHIRSCCCLHPAKIGHHSFAFPREKRDPHDLFSDPSLSLFCNARSCHVWKIQRFWIYYHIQKWNNFLFEKTKWKLYWLVFVSNHHLIFAAAVVFIQRKFGTTPPLFEERREIHHLFFLIHLFPFLQCQIMSCVKNSQILDIYHI